MMVQPSDAGVVIGELAANIIGGTWPGRELFIAHRQFTVVERMHRHVCAGQGNLRRIVEIHKFLLGDARVVRNGRGEINEKWAVIFSIAQILNDLVGMAATRSRALCWWVVGTTDVFL